MIRLIVNADDLGRTIGINDGIFEAHKRGIVTSATLMVGFPAARAAAAILHHLPCLGVGLHLTLTGGQPTLPPEDVSSLVDKDGKFPRSPLYISAPEPREVANEFESQLRCFVDLVGRLPTHLDSHHHAHEHPVLLEAVIELALRYRLPVRSSTPAIRERLLASGIRTTDQFLDQFYGSQVSKSGLMQMLRELPNGTTELMCHPGRVDSDLALTSSYTADRERELALLTDSEVVATVRALNCKLIHFGEL